MKPPQLPCAGHGPPLVLALLWSWPCAGHGPPLVLALLWSWPCAGHGPPLVLALLWSWPCAGRGPPLVLKPPQLPCSGRGPALVLKPPQLPCSGRGPALNLPCAGPGPPLVLKPPQLPCAGPGPALALNRPYTAPLDALRLGWSLGDLLYCFLSVQHLMWTIRGWLTALHGGHSVRGPALKAACPQPQLSHSTASQQTQQIGMFRNTHPTRLTGYAFQALCY